MGWGGGDKQRCEGKFNWKTNASGTWMYSLLITRLSATHAHTHTVHTLTLVDLQYFHCAENILLKSGFNSAVLARV